MQLIAKDKVLTNRHCIPLEIQEVGAQCEGKIKVKFPKTNKFETEEIDCSQVVALSSHYNKTDPSHPDWAIIKLKTESVRSPVHLNLRGVDHKQSLHLYPVFYTEYPEKLGFFGEIRKVECQSSMLHVLSKMYFHSQAPIVTAAHCSEGLVPGTSGSGFHNQNGELVAVGSFGMRDPRTIKDVFGTRVDLSNHVMGATNLHCIEALNQERSLFCDLDPSFESTPEATELMVQNTFLHSDLMINRVNRFKDMKSDLPFEWDNFIERADTVSMSWASEDPSATFVDQLILENKQKIMLPTLPKCTHHSSKQVQEVPLLVVNYDYIQVTVDPDGDLALTFDTDIFNLPLSVENGNFVASAQKDKKQYSMGFDWLTRENVQSIKVDLPECEPSP